MYARVTTFPGLAPERIKATLEEFKAKHLPLLEQQSGYRGVWAGVDFTGGRAIAGLRVPWSDNVAVAFVAGRGGARKLVELAAVENYPTTLCSGRVKPRRHGFLE